MNIKNKMIMEEYRAEKSNFLQLGDIVSEKMKNAVSDAGIMVLAVEHRVKTETSLAGKLELKDDKYHFLSDITDILGMRVICFFSDDVDKITGLVEEMFDIDRENSVDKRAQLNPNAFGYLSVHFVCSLKNDGTYPEDLCSKKFEIQIRSTLQHTWAEIEHDLGYKSEFGVPRAIRREFSRVAGLLEIADEQFINIRNSLRSYGSEIRARIADGTADEIPIDLVSLSEYIEHNKLMREFLSELAALCGAEIRQISPESYLDQLDRLGMKTLGDIGRMISDNRELAVRLAGRVLTDSELDILSSNVGLRYLCRAELLRRGASRDEIIEFISLTVINRKRAEIQADGLIQAYGMLKG